MNVNVCHQDSGDPESMSSEPKALESILRHEINHQDRYRLHRVRLFTFSQLLLISFKVREEVSPHQDGCVPELEKGGVSCRYSNELKRRIG